MSNMRKQAAEVAEMKKEMQARYLEPGTKVKVSWQQGDACTFVDVLDGARAGELVPCRSSSMATSGEDQAVITSAVRGDRQDDPLDPLRRPAASLELQQRPTLQGDAKDARKPVRAGKPAANAKSAGKRR